MCWENASRRLAVFAKNTRETAHFNPPSRPLHTGTGTHKPSARRRRKGLPWSLSFFFAKQEEGKKSRLIKPPHPTNIHRQAHTPLQRMEEDQTKRPLQQEQADFVQQGGVSLVKNNDGGGNGGTMQDKKKEEEEEARNKKKLEAESRAATRAAQAKEKAETRAAINKWIREMERVEKKKRKKETDRHNKWIMGLGGAKKTKTKKKTPPQKVKHQRVSIKAVMAAAEARAVAAVLEQE